MAKVYQTKNITRKLNKIQEYAQKLLDFACNCADNGIRKSELIKLNSCNAKITKDVVGLTEEVEKIDSKD